MAALRFFQGSDPGFLAGLFGNFQLQGISGADNDRAFDYIAQFSDIARPVIPLQGVNAFPGKFLNPLTHFLGKFLSKEFDQKGDILVYFLMTS